jgi:hypothetical protein
MIRIKTLLSRVFALQSHGKAGLDIADIEKAIYFGLPECSYSELEIWRALGTRTFSMSYSTQRIKC